MPIVNLTGSQTERFNEIQQRGLVFSPPTSSKFYSYPLYTVPIGQTYAPEIIMETGSFSMVSGSLLVEKVIHVYESETEAANFINSIGQENIASFIRKPFLRENGSVYFHTEIQLINYPIISFPISLKDAEVQRGFKIEVFLSGANGLTEIDDDPIYNNQGELVSDTYLKYFEVSDR